MEPWKEQSLFKERDISAQVAQTYSAFNYMVN